MNNRNDYEPFNAQELIDNLNAANAKRPPVFSSDGLTRHEEETAFRRHLKEMGVWQREVWEPAADAVRDANIKVKYDYLTGRYYARFDADGLERFTIRVACKRYFDVIVSAADAEEAKEIAMRAMNHEQKIARDANKKARFTFETTTEDTSSVASV